MKICLAQIQPSKGDISSNIVKHRAFIERAVFLRASAIFFPELSLTGYVPKLAKKLVCSADDSRFEEFQEISSRENLFIGMGLPTKSESEIFISMIIFQPDGQHAIYSKQELHSDELPYFRKGSEQLTITINNKKIAPAICYESLKPDHARKAHQHGAEIYLASVAKSVDGIDKGMSHYPKIAIEYSMSVLMVNCVGYCDTFMGAGQSAAWTKEGLLAGYLNDKDEGILMFDTETEQARPVTVA